ncbi:Hypothetical predicted protein [Paramuricea clavata]|uniref:Uncharacterized protein n=1 Tax=Paramuricea clavata TaxID=317549 RepID=A0A6S7I0U2_PARCT|nr:Hypothetical predicted protein [Paramuricea clavata]
MTTTRQQLTIASFGELWKNEFLSEIQKEIDSANASLYTEIRDLNKRLGIPTLPNDKPKNIVMELGATLGVLLNENDISTAHRLPLTRKIQDRIIVKFVRRNI